MSNYTYTERAEETYKQRTYNRDSSKESFFKPGFKFFQPKDGNNRVRILPPTWQNPDHYGIDIHMHYKIGGSNSSYLCLNKMKNTSCPICEALAKPEMKNDKENSDAIGIKKKVLVWCIDRADEATGPKLWAMPTSLDRAFVIQSADDITGEILRIDHPDKGYDVSFDKSGKEIKTKYEGEKIARHATPLSSDKKLADTWIDFIVDNPLPSVLQHFDYDHVKAVFNGNVPGVEEKEKPVVEEKEVKESSEESERDIWMEKGLQAGMSFKELKEMTNKQIQYALETPKDEKVSTETDDNMQEALRRKIKEKYGK
jgi:hypothetical protein